MVDYADSSHLNLWHFDTMEELDICRTYTNWKARQFLYEREEQSQSQDNNSTSSTLPVSHYVCNRKERNEIVELARKDESNNGNSDSYYAEKGPLESPSGNPYLTAKEEAVLISFYVSKLPILIGPDAELSRLRRESKVLATAGTYFRRFFLSNSCQLYDPKAILAASAFLASKTEDSTLDIKYLELGMKEMGVTGVTQNDIVVAEIALISGINFNLLCFHPYKPILSLTEDLRTFFKTAAGKNLLQKQQQQQQNMDNGNNSPNREEPVMITGSDLKPMYDAAREMLDRVILSDLIFLFTPGQIGLACLNISQSLTDSRNKRIDFFEYLQARFPSQEQMDWMTEHLQRLTDMLQELKQNNNDKSNDNDNNAADDAIIKYGYFGNNKHSSSDLMTVLKAYNKKLKKVRAWGEQQKKSSSSKKSSKKKKKRNKDREDAGESNSERQQKKVKVVVPPDNTTS